MTPKNPKARTKNKDTTLRRPPKNDRKLRQEPRIEEDWEGRCSPEEELRRWPFVETDKDYEPCSLRLMSSCSISSSFLCSGDRESFLVLSCWESGGLVEALTPFV